MLELRSVGVAYGSPLLSDISLSVDEGSIVGLVGKSGEGKSSLLRIIAGLQNAQEGAVFWKGNRIPGPSDVLIPGHPDIQLVNQDFGLQEYQTVYENVLQRMLYLEKDVRHSFAMELLELTGLTELRDNKALTLSGGEQQRLSIARALAAEPQVLLLDEPFAHLDVHLRERIGLYLKKLAALRNMTCILVSHDGADLMEWCSVIHYLSQGEIMRSDTPENFYYYPSDRTEGLFFGELNKISSTGELFRPTQFELTDETATNAIPVRFVSAQFAGPYYKNHVCTNDGDELVLFSPEALTHAKAIRIAKIS